MSNRKIHDVVGAVSGAAAMYLRTTDVATEDRLFLVLGGGLGGLAASRLPDILEPANSAVHRSLAHSVVAGGGQLAVQRRIDELSQNLRAHARGYDEAARHATGLAWVLSTLMKWISLVLAGAVQALPIGYLSHLALDATTPRGLPVVA